MLSFFKSMHPYAIVLIVLTGLVLWIPVFIKPAFFIYEASLTISPFDDAFKGLYALPVQAKMIFGLIVWLLLAFLLPVINTQNNLIEKRSYLPALFFILSSGWISGIQQISPALLGLFFIALGFMRFFYVFRENKNISALFDSGFLFTLGSLFYLPFIVLIFVVWIGLLIFRYTGWRDWFISLSGFLTPWWILYGIQFFITGSVNDLNEMILAVFHFGSFSFVLEPGRMVSFVFIAIFALYTTFSLFSQFNMKMVRSKRYFFILGWLFIILAVTYLFLQPQDRSFLVIGLAFPASYIFANYFSFARETWITKTIFSIYLAGMVLSMYIPFFY